MVSTRLILSIVNSEIVLPVIGAFVSKCERTSNAENYTFGLKMCGYQDLMESALSCDNNITLLLQEKTMLNQIIPDNAVI